MRRRGAAADLARAAGVQMRGRMQEAVTVLLTSAGEGGGGGSVGLAPLAGGTRCASPRYCVRGVLGVGLAMPASASSARMVSSGIVPCQWSQCQPLAA